MGSDVVFDDRLELRGDIRPAQRHNLLTIHENRRRRLLAGAWETDANIGMFALARPIDDTAHDRNRHVLHAFIAGAPLVHFRTDVALHLAGEFLKNRTGSAPAPGTRGDQRHKRTQAHNLQKLLRDDHFLSAIASRFRRQRHPDRIANSTLEENRHRGGRGDNALGSHPRLGQAQM